MIQRAVFAGVLALALAATTAGAQGINLALNDCGANGVTDAPADCATNTGIAMSMIGSVVPPAGLDRMVAAEGLLDCQTSGAFLTNWWQLDACRATALTFSFDFTAGPFSCNDYWAGQASGGGGISPSHPAPNRFRIYFVGATADEHPIDPALEHYLIRINILRSKSTSTGACPGCTDAACLVLNYVRLDQPADADHDVTITTPIVGTYVTYNGGVIALGCPGALPARNRTWGQVKSLYR